MTSWEIAEKRRDYLFHHKYPAATEAVWNALFRLSGWAALTKNCVLTDEHDAIVSQLIEDLALTNDHLASEANSGTAESPTVASARSWMNDFLTYRLSLDELTTSAVARLYAEVRRPIVEALHARWKEEDADEFFSEPEASADKRYWSSLASWTMDEAAALSLGKDPKLVNNKTLNSVSRGSPFLREYRRRLDVMKRAIAAGVLKEPLSPDKVALWARNQLDFDGFQGIAENTDLGSAESNFGRENSYRKLVLGLLLSRDSFSPAESELVGSKVFSAISLELQAMGIRLHSDTIRTIIFECIEAGQAKGGPWDKPRKRYKDSW